MHVVSGGILNLISLFFTSTVKWRVFWRNFDHFYRRSNYLMKLIWTRIIE